MTLPPETLVPKRSETPASDCSGPEAMRKCHSSKCLSPRQTICIMAPVCLDFPIWTTALLGPIYLPDPSWPDLPAFSTQALSLLGPQRDMGTFLGHRRPSENPE